MWKFLGLLALCGLLSLSEGKQCGHRACTSGGKFGNVLSQSLQKDGVFLKQFQAVPFSDVGLGSILGLLNSITGLNCVDVQVTGFNNVLVPSTSGGELTLSLTVKLGGSTLLSNVVNIIFVVSVNVQYRFANYANGSFDFVFSQCTFTFGPFQISIVGINLTAPIQSKIRDSIIADLGPQLCGILKTAFDLTKGFFVNSFNGRFSLGPYGTLVTQLASAPAATAQGLLVDLYSDVELPDGTMLSIPDSDGSINSPSLDNFNHALAFHPSLVNHLLTAFAPKGPREVSCTPDIFSGADDLKNAVLALLSPGDQEIAIAGILYLRLNIVVNPQAVFGTNTITISVGVQIDIFVRNLDGSNYAIVSVQASVTLIGALTSVGGKLIFSVTFSGIAVALTDSPIGIVDVSTLEPHCGNLVRDVALPAVNQNLALGIPSPSIFGIGITNPTLKNVEGCPVAYV